jgi:hypothetical protein
VAAAAAATTAVAAAKQYARKQAPDAWNSSSAVTVSAKGHGQLQYTEPWYKALC